MRPFRILRRVIALAMLGSALATFALAGPVAADYPVIYGALHACPGATVSQSLPLRVRSAKANPPNYANNETLTFGQIGLA